MTAGFSGNLLTMDEKAATHRHCDVVEVYRPGTKVICDDSVEMIVVLVRLSCGDVDYNCEWWRDSTLDSGWFNSSRLRSTNGNERKTVGFRR